MKILSVNILSSSTLNIEGTQFFASFAALAKYMQKMDYRDNKFGIMSDGVEERFDITEENIRKEYLVAHSIGLSPWLIVRRDFVVYTIKNYITICETEVYE